MFSRIWLINAVLLFFIVFFSLKAYGVWVQGNKGDALSQMGGKTVQSVPKPVVALSERKIPPEAKYDALMTLNLFSPERTEILSDTTKPEETTNTLSAAEQKHIKQNFSRFVLYGLVITDNSAEALVAHPTTTPISIRRRKQIGDNPRRKRIKQTVKQTKWVKAGETLGDFKVVAVKPDRVLLEAGGLSYELLLYDKGNIKSRAPAKPKTAPTVVGVPLKPVANVKVEKTTPPFPVKKGTAARALSGAAPPAIRKDLKTDIKSQKQGK